LIESNAPFTESFGFVICREGGKGEREEEEEIPRRKHKKC